MKRDYTADFEVYGEKAQNPENAEVDIFVAVKAWKMEIKTNSKVTDKFENYPDIVRDKMQFLRELVIETAEETEGVKELEETLKWDEPSFLTKNGSTLRMDWKKRHPINIKCILSVQVDW